MMRQDDDGGWEVYDPPNKQYYVAVLIERSGKLHQSLRIPEH